MKFYKNFYTCYINKWSILNCQMVIVHSYNSKLIKKRYVMKQLWKFLPHFCAPANPLLGSN